MAHCANCHKDKIDNADTSVTPPKPADQRCPKCGVHISQMKGSVWPDTVTGSPDDFPVDARGELRIPPGTTRPAWVSNAVVIPLATKPPMKLPSWTMLVIGGGLGLAALVAILYAVLSGDDAPPSAARRNRIANGIAAEASGRRNEDPPNAPASANGSDNNEGNGTTQDQNASGGEQAGTDGQQASNDNGNGQQTGDQRQQEGNSNPTAANDGQQDEREEGQQATQPAAYRPRFQPPLRVPPPAPTCSGAHPRLVPYTLWSPTWAADASVRVVQSGPEECDAPPGPPQQAWTVTTGPQRRQGRFVWKCCTPRPVRPAA